MHMDQLWGNYGNNTVKRLKMTKPKTEEEWKIFDINNGITFCIDCHDLTKLGEAT